MTATSIPLRVAVIFSQLGPYHVARLAAASARVGFERFLAIEVAAESHEYAWDRVETQGFRRRTVIRDRSYEDVPDAERALALRRALDDEQPETVAIAGWGFAESRAALGWCRRNGRTAILMSESQERDAQRHWISERIKRTLVGEFDAAMVGGRRHVDYLVKLGMPAARITLGYDVVDNDHFARGADEARRAEQEQRRRRALPADYFLCSARFIPKKNLVELLRAYSEYRKLAGLGSWKLVLLGDGPLRPRLEEEVRALGLESDVLLPGFKQYQDLPAYYGLARAFILPSLSEQWGLVVNEAMAAGLAILVSEACGSSELVEPGANGWVFDPTDRKALVECMRALSRDPAGTVRKGNCSRRVVAFWGPAAFGEGLAKAAEIGEEHLKSRQRRLGSNLVLRF